LTLRKLRCGVENLREHFARQALDGQQVGQLAIGVELWIELDAGRTTVVEQFVDRRARRAAGIQHVIDEDQWPAFDIEGNRTRLDACMQAPSP
jgi:hypothetical protein